MKLTKLIPITSYLLMLTNLWKITKLIKVIRLSQVSLSIWLNLIHLSNLCRLMRMMILGKRNSTRVFLKLRISRLRDLIVKRGGGSIETMAVTLLTTKLISKREKWWMKYPSSNYLTNILSDQVLMVLRRSRLELIKDNSIPMTCITKTSIHPNPWN